MTVLSWSLTDFAIRCGRTYSQIAASGGLSIENSAPRAKRIVRWHDHCSSTYRIAHDERISYHLWTNSELGLKVETVFSLSFKRTANGKQSRIRRQQL
jgi:hypothetical protein